MLRDTQEGGSTFLPLDVYFRTRLREGPSPKGRVASHRLDRLNSALVWQEKGSGTVNVIRDADVLLIQENVPNNHIASAEQYSKQIVGSPTDQHQINN